MTIPPFENRGARGRVLLLERTSLLREVQQLLLKHAGYETVACDEPAAGLAKLDAHAIDVLVVDATHPEFVSPEFLHAVRQTRRLAILAVVWHPGALATPDLLSRGCDAVLDSPPSASAIIEAVDKLVGFRISPAAPAGVEPRATPTRSDRVVIRVSERTEARASLATADTNSTVAWAVDDTCTPH